MCRDQNLISETDGRTDVRTNENWKARCRPAPLGSGKKLEWHFMQTNSKNIVKVNSYDLKERFFSRYGFPKTFLGKYAWRSRWSSCVLLPFCQANGSLSVRNRWTDTKRILGKLLCIRIVLPLMGKPWDGRVRGRIWIYWPGQCAKKRRMNQSSFLYKPHRSISYQTTIFTFLPNQLFKIPCSYYQKCKNTRFVNRYEKLFLCP